jgi:murein DD-endopeptidase MepM/ murein hydrolase activator NlpD
MQRPESNAPESDPHSRPRDQRGRKRESRGRFGTLSAIGAIIFLATWAGGATIYILFNDEALKYLVERQVSITRSYETQAASLQTEIDRLRSLKLIDQERIDRAVADLARRQTIIDTRQSALSALAVANPKLQSATAKTTGSLPAVERQAPAAAPAPKPSPLSDTILITPANERWARLESRPLPPLGPTLNAHAAETATEVRLINLGRDLRRLEAAQSFALNNLEVSYDSREQRMRKVLDDLGVKPGRDSARFAANRGAQGASGGPFLPWTRPSDDPFARQIHRIRSSAMSVGALEKEIDAIPVRRPTAGETDITSSFGVRLDPFLRQPAMHTGIDFRGDAGDPVHATAAGRVVQAERNGGYGQMVEIDHGNGLVTRYAHLSAIAVSNGTAVAPGDLIGRIGSTGRSTGPHLHYEIRMQGEASDPQRFLRAGLRLEARN